MSLEKQDPIEKTNHLTAETDDATPPETDFMKFWVSHRGFGFTKLGKIKLPDVSMAAVLMIGAVVFFLAVFRGCG